MVKKFTTLLTLGFIVAACAIMDLEPQAGFPDQIDEAQTSPTLLPSDAYDFHNNPRL